MYSETDIDAAVAAGALTPASAQALRDSVAAGRHASAADEEGFRLLTGFNDIFVAIAAILLLAAVGWLGFGLGRALLPTPTRWSDGFPDHDPYVRSIGLGLALAGGLVAAAAWGLAEYFTRRRRMALPSIVLLAAFEGGVAMAGVGLVTLLLGPGDHGRLVSALAALVALGTAGAAWLHWRRFRVPITIAALTGALVATVLALVLAAAPGAARLLPWLTLVAGLAVFGFAMWWDMSDRARTTRRSDVAFWLHLAAAPMIAHPVFNLLGVLHGGAGAGGAVAVLLLYLLFGVVALAVDRRALLVSGLVYVLAALADLFRAAGDVGASLALTGLMIGSGLLLLSAFWARARRQVVVRLPAGLQVRLPHVDRIAARPA